MSKEEKRIFYFFLLFGGFFALHAQISITSTPHLQNDTIKLCLSSNNSMSIQASYSNPHDSITWTFQTGSPSKAKGNGPFTVTYNTIGNKPLIVRVYNGGSVVHTHLLRVDVKQHTAVSFVPSQTTFCQSDPVFTLDGYAPSGGYFRGPGISGNTFNPDGIGTGSKTIWYVYENGACKDSASVNMNILATPNTSLMSTGNQVDFEGELVYTLCPP